MIQRHWWFFLPNVYVQVLHWNAANRQGNPWNLHSFSVTVTHTSPTAVILNTIPDWMRSKEQKWPTEQKCASQWIWKPWSAPEVCLVKGSNKTKVPLSRGLSVSIFQYDCYVCLCYTPQLTLGIYCYQVQGYHVNLLLFGDILQCSISSHS